MKTYANSLLSLLLFTGTIGCTSDEHYPLSKQGRVALGASIGIGVQPITAKPAIDTPYMHYRSDVAAKDRLTGAGKQALEGAKSGASVAKVWGLPGGCRYAKGCALILALALATAIPGATVGGVTGAASGALAGDVEISQEVAEAINEASIPQKLEETIMTKLKDLASYRFSKISYPEGSNVPLDIDFIASIGSQGLDSIVELSLTQMAFLGTSPNGPHHLSIEVRVRVFRTHDQALIAVRNWSYNSDEWSRKYTLMEWQADNARLLNEGIDHFSQLIAWYVKSEFFTCPVGYYCGQ